MKSEGKKKANKVPTKLMLAWNSRSVSMAISVVLMMQVTYYSTEILGIGFSGSWSIVYGSEAI